MPCKLGEFRNESYICQKGCLQFNRPDFEVVAGGVAFRVNCTFNCPDQHRIT